VKFGLVKIPFYTKLILTYRNLISTDLPTDFFGNYIWKDMFPNNRKFMHTSDLFLLTISWDIESSSTFCFSIILSRLDISLWSIWSSLSLSVNRAVSSCSDWEGALACSCSRSFDLSDRINCSCCDRRSSRPFWEIRKTIWKRDAFI